MNTQPGARDLPRSPGRLVCLRALEPSAEDAPGGQRLLVPRSSWGQRLTDGIGALEALGASWPAGAADQPA